MKKGKKISDVQPYSILKRIEELEKRIEKLEKQK
jgi:hypothetical protein